MSTAILEPEEVVRFSDEARRAVYDAIALRREFEFAGPWLIQIETPAGRRDGARRRTKHLERAPEWLAPAQ